MKTRPLLACALAAALGFGSCALYMQGAQAQTNQTHPQGQGQGMGHGAGKSPKMATTTKMSTPAFIPRAQISDQFEVEAGKIAAQRAQKAEVRQFGQMMVTDHTQAASKFTMAVEKSGIKPTMASLDADHLNMLEQLRTASTPAFDRTYVIMQIEAHEKALSLHQGYAQGGDKAPLKAASAEMVPIIQHHLQELRKLSAGLSTDSPRTN